jgi:hypothetical protein
VPGELNGRHELTEVEVGFAGRVIGMCGACGDTVFDWSFVAPVRSLFAPTGSVDSHLCALSERARVALSSLR